MQNARFARRSLVVLASLVALSSCVAISETSAPVPDSVRAELAALRAREEIRELIHAYGATLDARDFDAFEALWATDAVYAGGAGGTGVVGPAAIAGSLEQIFAANPSGLAGPSFHLFFNEHIEVAGDRGSGTSMGAFVAGGPGGEARIVILATYEDDYVLEDGRWKFARRAVRAGLPAPAR